MKKIPTWEEMEQSGMWDDYSSMAREYTKQHLKAQTEAIVDRLKHYYFAQGVDYQNIIKGIKNSYPELNIK